MPVLSRLGRAAAALTALVAPLPSGALAQPVLNRHLAGFKGTDPVTQLIPVSAFAVLSGVYVVNAAIPGNTPGEVIQYSGNAPNPCAFLGMRVAA